MQNWRRRGRGGSQRITARLDAHESELIASLVGSMTELLDERSQSAPTDDLSALTGIETGHSAPPDDATLGRLLPDFHRPDQDRELVADTVTGDLNGALRSVHEPHIIATKMSAAQVVLDTLPPGGGDVSLTPAQAEQWLTAVNDVRLALGAMLGVTEHTPDQLPPDDPQAAHLDVYHWLTVVQELLVVALMGK
ncbi:DUF2017 domain-containing protein [Williamsia sp. MIQD14]|uniref:DUF2017 domain-containing protein n=1 Tax=Williamsia herbipolensis TaxID=1603258 RepID=A0AAU4K2V8_9NOCA|nr:MULTISPECIES: DUF2017 domain-containing protein [Williamsia]KQR99076.1 hypothetical protein ASG12_11500 [Williamsia sp. Leaf354]MCX6467737.1 DUF2017 domain-containing protein [Mycobacteriales bacterium]